MKIFILHIQKPLSMKKTNKFIFMILLLSQIIPNCIAQKVSDIFENTLSGVVTVAVYENKVANKLYGFRGKPTISQTAYEKALNLNGVRSTGSGFVIERNGQKYVITNAHVVELAAESDSALTVFSVSRKKYWMKVIGGDSFYDIAVLAFVTPPTDEFQALEFRTTSAQLGEKVFAIGNPLGEYPYSITDGIISAKNRTRGGITGKFGFLQTTATVIWGSSGGPLIDEQGKIVGINSQIAFANQSGKQLWQPQINFALEGELSQRLINDILTNNGVVKRAYLGIELSKGNFTSIAGFDEFPVISKLMADAPEALFQSLGHELRAVNGVETRNLEEALGELEKVLPFMSINLTLANNGKVYNLEVLTKLLTYEQLENLAKTLLEEWNINIEEDQGKLYFIHKKEIIIPAKKIAGKPRIPAKTMIIEQKKYIFVVGHLEEEKIWFVENLVDMGSILRLLGLTGSIDLWISNVKEITNDFETLHKTFIDKEENKKLLLWY